MRTMRRHKRSQLSDQFEETCRLVAKTFLGDSERDSEPFGFHGYLRWTDRAPEIMEVYEELEAQKRRLEKPQLPFWIRAASWGRSRITSFGKKSNLLERKKTGSSVAKRSWRTRP